MRYKYTDEDIEFLKIYYPVGNWDKIFKRFPNVSKQAIFSKMSKLKIPYNKNFKDKDKDNGSCKVKRQAWTDEEIKIIKDNYSIHDISYVQTLLSSRSKNAIILMANKLGVPSFNKMNAAWTNEEEQYIRDNWELEPDKIMAIKLNKTQRSVQWKRLELELYRRDMNSNTYTSLSKYLRGQNQKWKKDSMKNCDYKCVLTGSKNFEIHHLYGVSNMIEDIFVQNNIMYKENLSDYTDEELSFILDKFLEIQSSYPLGECIDKKLHILFHSLYGQYYNTQEQWNRFKNDYLKGVYKNID